MANQYPFWKKELESLSSLVNGISSDFPICITGIPSYERTYAVELVLKEKNIDYFVHSCTSRSTIRSILYSVCLHIARIQGLSYLMKSTGELLVDVQEYSQTYFNSHNQEKSFYCVFDNCENVDSDTFELIGKLASKVPHLGVILLTISIDAYKVFPSFIIHFPVISDKEIESVLMADCPSSSFVSFQSIVRSIIRYFGMQTHSISELKTLRDIAIAYCNDHEVTSEEEADKYIKGLQNSLFVNIMPVYTDHMDSVLDPNGAIPLSDFCGVDISYNAKLLLIASYLCSIYPESEDFKLFGKDDSLSIKTKGRKRRSVKPVMSPTKSNFFSLQRLVALFSSIKQTIFPDSHSISTTYGLVLSQINVLLQLGLIAQVGGNSHSINLNQVLYRCCINRVNVINIAKNIQFDIMPFI